MSAAATGSHEGQLGTRPRRIPARLLRLASDERLVELLRAGSEPAFEAIYARHHRGVLSFCRHMLGSVEEAEDAVQHTFMAAYSDLLGSGKEIRLRPWLYAIARNRCLTVLRTRRDGVEEAGEPATEKLSAEVERRWELRALLGDLARLPDDQRAALVLAELGDLSHDDIGAALGCPREKVKALVFQARSSLIASREAREASCDEIREQLANLRGGALRRNLLRRHVRECDGCRRFYEHVRAQRRELALILPVTPSLGLKAAVLGGGGAAATSSVVAKTAIVLAVAGGGTAAVETVREERERPRPAATAPEPPAAPAAVAGVVETDEAVPMSTPAPAEAIPIPAASRPATARVPKADQPRRRKARRPNAPEARPTPEHAGAVPPGQAKKAEPVVPPGQEKKAEPVVPPGQAKKSVPPAGEEPAPRAREKAPEQAAPRERAKEPQADVRAEAPEAVVRPTPEKAVQPKAEKVVAPGQEKKADEVEPAARGKQAE